MIRKTVANKQIRNCTRYKHQNSILNTPKKLCFTQYWHLVRLKSYFMFYVIKITFGAYKKKRKHIWGALWHN